MSNIFCYSNQLKTINIKGNRAIDLRFFFLFKDNPNLNYICCDEHNIISIKNISIFNGQNCEVNSYCSFTPGGKFYTIKGNNGFDVNNSGCDDQDLKASHIKYNITNGTASGTFLSNSTGNYSFPVQAGTHTIIPQLEYPDHFEVTPSSITVLSFYIRHHHPKLLHHTQRYFTPNQYYSPTTNSTSQTRI
ncbi:MAG: hypothetical protein IPN86_19915 [Saprospiraceae bacterium]|nr:hypothetical protein [Saprospiraceae bacterium]